MLARVVSGDVRLDAEPTFVMIVLLGPEVPVIVTFDQLPRTTLEAVLAAIEPEANEPADAMKVPPSDACRAVGVSARVARFLPQIAIV